MIDISTETVIPLREVPRHLPARPNGKRVHVSACYRWISRGVRGAHLDSITIGGSTYTSKEALQRFANQLGSPEKHQTASSPVSTATRRKQIDRASRRLRDVLGRHETGDATCPSGDPVGVKGKAVRK